MSNKINKAELREQGMSEKDIQEVVEYEDQQKAAKDFKEWEENEASLIKRVDSKKKEEHEEALEIMKGEQLLGSDIGKTIIAFVNALIADADIELNPIFRGEDNCETASFFEIEETYVDLIFSDKNYRQGMFHFEYSALKKSKDGESIEVDMKKAFIGNFKYWAKKTRSLVLFNAMGDRHTESLVYSDYWMKDKGTARLLNRLKKYRDFYWERSRFEDIMEKITPSIAKMVISELKNKEEYKDIL